uniref:Uncharacterized protein n=1 Tax=viral metagenome TaxID=1070528 RepID=A0A6M3JA07_9ZZZZ
MTQEQANNVEVTKKREEAARLRSLAAGQKEYAAAHMRQAQHPIYAGQEEVCAGKASQLEAFAEQNLAIAARLDLEVQLLQ